MNRRHFLATALAAPLAVGAAPVPAPVLFDHVIEPVRPKPGELVGWEIRCRRKLNHDTFVVSGKDWAGYEKWSAYVHEHLPWPEWCRITTTKRSFPLPVWEPLHPPKINAK